MVEQRTIDHVVLYRCLCGGFPRAQLMGTLVCDRCGNYREDTANPINPLPEPLTSNLQVDIQRCYCCELPELVVLTLQRCDDEIERLTAELAEVQRMRNAEMYPQPRLPDETAATHCECGLILPAPGYTCAGCGKRAAANGSEQHIVTRSNDGER